MTHGQLDAELTLHGADQFYRRAFPEQMLNQRKVGEIVFNIEERLGFAAELSELNRSTAIGIDLFLDAFYDWKFNPKARAQRRSAFTNRSAHRFGQTLG